MLRIHSLFPLTNTSNSASLARNVPFFIALMVKLEFFVTKQRSAKNETKQTNHNRTSAGYFSSGFTNSYADDEKPIGLKKNKDDDAYGKNPESEI